MRYFNAKAFYVCLVLMLLALSNYSQVKPSKELIDSAGKKGLNNLKDKASETINEKSAQLKEKSKIFKEKTVQFTAKRKMVGDSIRKNKPVDLSNIAFENATLLTGNDFNVGKMKAINNFSVFGQIKIYGFPLAIDLATNAGAFEEMNPIQNGLFKMGFDRSQYQQGYQNELEKFSNFRKAKLGGLDIAAYLKKQISQQLRSSLNLNLPDFPRLNAVLNNREQLTALLSLDTAQIRERINDLMSDQVKTGNYKIDSLSEAKKAQALNEVNKKKARVADTVIKLKADIADNGLDQQRLQLLQKFVNNRGSLSDMEALFEHEMNQQQNLSPFARFYSKIRSLQAGDFGKKMPGSFLNREQMIKGGSMTVRTLRGPVDLGLGLSKDIGMPKDAQYSGSIFDAPKLLTFISIPTSNFSFGRGRLSWIGTFDRQGSQGINQVNSLPKNGLTFIASQDLSFNAGGKFTLEVSKSSTQYKNITISESDKLVLNNDLKSGNYFRDDFLETMSFGLKHNIELKKFGLVSNAFISYSGLGYQNPGQQGYSSMGMRVGGNLKKSMFRNKVVLNFRTDIKNTPVSAQSDAHWKNYNLNLDSRFKVSKHYSFNLKYAENGVDKVGGAMASVYSSQKVQADMNANYRLGTSYGLSNLSLGRQSMVNPTAAGRSEFMTFVYAQTFVFKSFSLSGNTFYNRELSGVKVLGDMLNADMGCQYTLFRNLSVSSALTYLDNQNIARQAGMRQTVQVSVLKHFDLSAFLDVRKNLVDPIYPDLFTKGRGELSIRYYLNK